MVGFVLTSDKVLLVRGPMEIITVGEASILGKDISNSKIFLDEDRVWPIETRSNCDIVISILQKKTNSVNDIWIRDRKNIGTKIWEEVGYTIFHSGATLPNSIMVIGPTDSGKTSLSTYILNQAIRAGLRPAVIDADIGQGDLAPPGVIGCGIVEKQILNLKEVSTKYFAFLGDINPTGYDKLIARSVMRLLNKINTGKKDRSEVNLVVINTDGYITGSGLLGKMAIANKVHPDIIIFLGEYTSDLCMLIKARKQSGNAPCLLYAKSPFSTNPVIKLKKERVQQRLNRFQRYISDFGKPGKIRSINLGKIKVVFKGLMYHKTFISSGDHLNLVNKYWTKKLPLARVFNMFVGLGKASNIVGFGVVSSITKQKIEIHTNVDFFDTIYLSKIGISMRTWRPYMIRSSNEEHPISTEQSSNH
ncbi:MAG: Clp1/GlmU family protein, partial [Nitrososphaeraceae archaeon]